MANSSTDAQETLKVGILGAANIAKKNVRAITKARTNIEVVAVASRDTARAEEFIKDTGLGGEVKALGSYEALLDDPNVDALYIPIPTSTHLKWVKAAAAKKKHMIVEKPIALTPEETDEMLKACRDAGVQFMDGTMWVHNPRAHRITEILSDRALLGDLKSVTTAFTFQGSKDFFQKDIRTKKDLDALGCLGDMGWYCIRASLWAFNYDPPATVTAHPGAVRNGEGVLMHVGATLLWADGRKATFDCGFDRALTANFEVAGSLGTVRMTDFVIPKREHEACFEVTGQHGFAHLDTRVTTEVDQHKIDLPVPQETMMWETFAECVRKIQKGEAPDKYWEHIAALTQKVVCAVDESASQDCKTIEFQY